MQLFKNADKTEDSFLHEAKGLISFLQSQAESSDFLHPVDYKKLKIPWYPKIIKQPMDLETIEKGYKNKKYTDIRQVLRDVQLIWSNCKKVNEEDSVIFIQQIVEYANIMEEKCEAYLSEHNLLPTHKESILPSKRKREKNTKYIEPDSDSNSEKRSFFEKDDKSISKQTESQDSSLVCNVYLASETEKDVANSHFELPLVSYRQQIALKEAVMKASIEVLTKIVKIVQKDNRAALQTEGDVFKIPVDKLSYKTYTKIRDLLNE